MNTDNLSLVARISRFPPARFSGFSVPAGFPSPATDYMENEIDFNCFLVTHPNATFTVRVKGDSMEEAHIPDGALLVVDRAIAPWNGAIVVAMIDGEFTVKTYERSMKGLRLLSAKADYAPLQITDMMDFQVWGVVTSIILMTGK